MANSSHRPKAFRVRSLVGRGLVHYRRTHLGVVAGVAVATGILTGALMVGDAVRGSLLKRVDQRLGRTTLVVSSGESFVSAALAERLGAALACETAGLIGVPAVATRPAGDVRANRIDAYGVDPAHWAMLAPQSVVPDLGEAHVVLNTRLAAHLGAGVGDAVILRFDKPGLMHRDLALSERADPTVVLRLTVSAIIGDREGGLFSLRSEQSVPMNAFLSRFLLARVLEQEAGVNLILIGGDDRLSETHVEEAVRQSWQAEDAGLSAHALDHGEWEVRSRRVFLDDKVVAAAQSALPGARPVLTYFVNAIQSGDRSTPYSFVSAPGEPLVPARMAPDELVVNQWLADDLGVGPGDPVTLRYFVMGSSRTLTETNHSFRVHGIVPLAGRALDPALMPALAGLSDVENCRDWETGLPIELGRVREKDEAYWDAYHGTPKAFVALPVAQALWRTRQGAATAIRGPLRNGSSGGILDRLMRELTPGDCGIRAMAVRANGLRAGREGVDFGQLFLGLSFFLIVAALLLTGMLFALGVEQRVAETGLLIALGWPLRLVRHIRYLEGACLAVPGALLGVGLGVGYSWTVMQGLRSIWHGAVGGGTVDMQVRLSTLGSGAAIGAVAAWIAMWLTVRSQLRRSPLEMQAARGAVATRAGRGARLGGAVGIACWIGVALLALCVRPGGGSEVAGAFFGAGALALVGCLALTYGGLAALSGRDKHAAVGLMEGGMRAAAMRPWHALGTVAVLAASTFLVVATGANRPGGDPDPLRRDAGTGGFSFYAESTLPVLQAPRELFDDEAVQFVSMRTHEGDDASCLNVNRVQTPPIWGLDPDALSARQAFSFAALGEGVDPDRPWDAIKGHLPDGAIPAIADQAVILWGLGKAVGDTIKVVDGRGQARELRLVAGLRNSLFQGKVLISESNFLELFPAAAGYRAFLIESARPDSEAVRTRLSRRFRDQGLEVRLATEHLASFSVVQNTYLSIFLLLGALGLLLGSLGMGVVVARHIMARRGELAMLRAVGFSRGALRVYLLSEHGLLLGLGLLSGTVAGLVAVWPALLSQGSTLSLGSLLLLLLGLIVNGLVWTALAAALATRGHPVLALRDE